MPTQNKRPTSKKTTSKKPKASRTTQFLAIFVLIVIVITIFYSFANTNSPRVLSNTEFETYLNSEVIKTVEI